MAVWRFVNFCVKEAQLLADLTGVEVDLNATEDICALLLTKTAEKQTDWTLTEALCAAALIRYGRAFGSGIRAGVPHEIIALLSDELQETHQYFKNLRDRWIAHSLNAFEENIVHAYLVPEERGPKGIASISVQHQRVITLSSEDIARLKALAAEIRKHVTNYIEQEKRKVLEYAQSLPVDDFYTQKDPPAKAPGGDARKLRKRY